MKTFSAKPTDVTREWLVVDATDVPVGRLASEVARLLQGKHKAIYTRHIDTGDFVVVVNAEKARLTGKKAEQKEYYRHSGYLGGLKVTPVSKVMAQKPADVIRRAVKGMLPRTRLGKVMLKKLKVHTGPDHPHTAQHPKSIKLQIQEKTGA